MAIEPDIIVTEEIVEEPDVTPGMRSTMAVIGAFDSTITEPTVCSTVTEAHTKFGTTETVDAFKGTDTIDFLFLGASKLIIVNTTTWSDDETPVADTTLTNQKLSDALTILKDEEFGSLVIAEELTDAAQTIVSNWLDTEFRGKFPHGQIAQLQKSTAAAYETSIATFRKHVYWICTQQYTYQGVQLSLNQSAALMAGYIASLEISKSLTSKIIPGITSVTPELNTETGTIGAKLLELSVPFLKVRNRLDNRYICLNSELPDGYDLYINRVRDYVIERIEAETLLGEPNSIEAAEMIVEKVYTECVTDGKYLKDIIYHVEKEDTKTAKLVLDALVFEDVTQIVKISYTIRRE
ncbi:hypothetical protein [uncultured Methanobrevibacter sp.]|uniref:hypothetical protein n=1 Tax=uncultured Methanobrevibacter sp. TaxID=253161 RepID=UPI0025CF55BA|nr:hypothetical protein [uncultured Methanobrevibacter sp.]